MSAFSHCSPVVEGSLTLRRKRSSLNPERGHFLFSTTPVSLFNVDTDSLYLLTMIFDTYNGVVSLLTSDNYKGLGNHTH